MTARTYLRWLSIPLVLLLGGTIARAQPVQPLAPSDRSSPRAAIQTFLDSGDALREFLARDYLPAPSRSKYEHLVLLAGKPIQDLDLSEVPPAARPKTGYAAANALYEILNRIPMPPPDQIPGAGQLKPAQGAELRRWVIPGTEIALVRANSGPHSGEFLFSADTVARADEFYERVRGLPYVRPVPLKELPELIATAGGWMIPYPWIQALPASLRMPVAGQAGWKWIGLALIAGILVLFLAITYRVSRLGDSLDPLPRAVVDLAMPIAVLVAMPAVEHLALVQLVLADSAGSGVELATTGVTILASAWLAWRLAVVVAEAIIAFPRARTERMEPHIVRAVAQMLGIAVATVLLASGADRLGIPLYGIVAGLGVGGLAVALAAQPTIENLIGGISLVADNAVRFGEICKYGDHLGTVEKVGIRSTRIRGDDRTLANIPNAVLAKMPIVSLTRRDQMLIQAVLGLSGAASPEQLRTVIARLRELLEGDSRLDPASAHVFLVNLGISSLDVEMSAYVRTTDTTEFFRVREEVLLRALDIIKQCGTPLAYSTQTLYFGDDRGGAPINANVAVVSIQKSQDREAPGEPSNERPV